MNRVTNRQEPFAMNIQRPQSLKDYIWQKQNYTMREFLETYMTQLPIVIKVTEGYYGLDQAHTFSSDEVIRIHGISRQKRVVARDVITDLVISIPVNYSRRVHMVMKNTKDCQPAMPLDECYEHLHRYKQTYHFRFEDDPKLDFVVGSETVHTTRFHDLEFVAEYDESYISGHAIHKGELNPVMLTIPVYLPISVHCCIGLQASLGGQSAWYQLLTHYSQVFKKLAPTRPYVNKDIILFDYANIGKMDGEYEYIAPLEIIYMRHQSVDAGDTGDNKPITKQQYVSGDLLDAIKNEASPKTSSTSRKPELIPRAKKPPIARPSVKVPPINGMPAISEISIDSHNNIVDVNAWPSVDDIKKIDILTLSNDKDDRGVLNLRPPEKLMPLPYSSNESNASERLPQDGKDFSVTQISECLKMLGMHKFIEAFRNRNVDGQLLHFMDVDSLVQEFGMTRFDAIQVQQYIVGGWRPKI